MSECLSSIVDEIDDGTVRVEVTLTDVVMGGMMVRVTTVTDLSTPGACGQVGPWLIENRICKKAIGCSAISA